jgi:hypothetical protein
LIDNIKKEYGTAENIIIPGAKSKLAAADSNYGAVINIHSMSLNMADKIIEVNQLRGDLLIRKIK